MATGHKRPHSTEKPRIEEDEEEGELLDEPEVQAAETVQREDLNDAPGVFTEQDAQLEGRASLELRDDAGDDPVAATSRWDDDVAEVEEPADSRSRWLMDDEDHDEDGPAPEGRTPGSNTAGPDPASPGEALTPAPTEAAPGPAEREPDRANMLADCRSKDAFDFLKEIGVGTYGAVHKARDRESNEIRALKKIKLENHNYQKEGFPMTSVREINILLSMEHDNIVNVTEVVTNTKNEIYMVMEFVQQDLKQFLERYKSKLKISEVKRILWQLLSAMAYLHENWVLHRDLKPANILYDHLGNVKICDFGLARRFGSPVHPMTPLVVTRNYRGPEIPMGVRTYSPALDMWSIGVILAELITQRVPFVKSESDLMLPETITKIIGSPHKVWRGFSKLPNADKINITRDQPSRLKELLGVTDDVQPGLMIDTALTPAGFDLVESMLRWDPATRITASAALKHEWFNEMPRKCEACFMPQYNAVLGLKYPRL